jgi:UDP-glucose 4-epimerase
LRYFNVYGPRQDPRSPYSGVISVFVDRLRGGKAPTVYGDGEQTRDFVYVADVVDANIRAMSAEYHGFHALNVASGNPTSLNRLLSELRQLTGNSRAATYADARAGDIRHSLGDFSLIQRELGYAPAYSLSQGLSLLIGSA